MALLRTIGLVTVHTSASSPYPSGDNLDRAVLCALGFVITLEHFSSNKIFQNGTMDASTQLLTFEPDRRFSVWSEELAQTNYGPVFVPYFVLINHKRLPVIHEASGFPLHARY